MTKISMTHFYIFSLYLCETFAFKNAALRTNSIVLFGGNAASITDDGLRQNNGWMAAIEKRRKDLRNELQTVERKINDLESRGQRSFTMSTVVKPKVKRQTSSIFKILKPQEEKRIQEKRVTLLTKLFNFWRSLVAFFKRIPAKLGIRRDKKVDFKDEKKVVLYDEEETLEDVMAMPQESASYSDNVINVKIASTLESAPAATKKEPPKSVFAEVGKMGDGVWAARKLEEIRKREATKSVPKEITSPSPSPEPVFSPATVAVAIESPAQLPFVDEEPIGDVTILQSAVEPIETSAAVVAEAQITSSVALPQEEDKQVQTTQVSKINESILSTFAPVLSETEDDPMYMKFETGNVDPYAYIPWENWSGGVVGGGAGGSGGEGGAGDDGKSMQEKIKSAGVSGTISYVTTEVGFWAVSGPIIAASYHSTTDVWLNPFLEEDRVGSPPLFTRPDMGCIFVIFKTSVSVFVCLF